MLTQHTFLVIDTKNVREHSLAELSKIFVDTDENSLLSLLYLSIYLCFSLIWPTYQSINDQNLCFSSPYKSIAKNDVLKYLRRNSSWAYLPPALEDSVNLMHVTSFYLKSKFLIEKSKNCACKVFDKKSH